MVGFSFQSMVSKSRFLLFFILFFFYDVEQVEMSQSLVSSMNSGRILLG